MNALFYCQHALGMGHLVRSLALASELAQAFDVCFLNGGLLPANAVVPAGITQVDLPPLGMDEDGRLVSHDPRYTPSAALQARAERLQHLLQERQPDLLLIELFPFGRKKFEPELIPLLEAARAQRAARGGRAPVVVCSVRDLLVTGRVDQQRFDDRAQQLCDRYFDLVLVHADPILAAFEESFRPRTALRTPIVHTGFLTRVEPPQPPRERGGVLVSAGGGLVGDRLFRTAVAAHERMWPGDRLPMTIVAGPFAPVDTVTWLERAAAEVPGLSVLPHVPDLRPHLRQAAVSVSQCGYNTALDLVSTATPAVVVPYGDDRENEQSRRATRLAARGVVHCLAPALLAPETLSAAIRGRLGTIPPVNVLRLDGAAETLRLLAAACQAKTESARQVTA